MSMQEGSNLIIDEMYIEAVDQVFNELASYLFSSESPSLSISNISVDQLRLDVLANSLMVFGITDPIGEIKQWFYDRLKEISSFFSSIVESITKPIKDVVDSIWSFIQGIPSSVISGIKGFIDTLSKSVSSIADSVRSYFTQIISQISNVVTSIASVLKDTASSILKSITDTLSSVGFALQSFISDLVSRLIDGIKTVGTALSYAFEKLSSALADIARSILDGVKSFFMTIGETIKNFWQNVIDSLGKLGSMVTEGIQKGISWLWDSVQGIVGKVWEGIQSFGKMVSDVFGKVWEGIQMGFKLLWDQIQGFGKWLWDSIQGGLKWIWETLSSIGAKIWEGLQWFGKSVADLFGRVWEGIQSGLRWVWDQLQGFGRWLWDSIQGGLRWLWDVLTSIGSRIWEGLQWFGRSVAEFFGRVWEGIQSGLRWVWEQLQRFGSWLWEQVYGGLKWLWDVLTGIGSRIWDGLQWFGRSVSELFTRVWEGIKGVGDLIWSGIQGFADMVQKTFADIGSRVMGALTTVGNTLANFGRMVVEGFARIGTALSDFAKIFDKWATTLMGGLSVIGNGFSQFLQTIANLPQTIQNMFKGVVDFFTKLGEGLANFVRDPAKWFKEHVVDPIWNGMVWLGQKIWDGLQTVWQYIVKGFSWLIDALKAVGESIWNSLVGFATWLANGVQRFAMGFINAIKDVASKFSEAVVGFLESVLLPHSPSTIDVAGQIVKKSLTEIMKALHPTPPVALTADKLAEAWGKSMLTIGIFYVFTRGVESLFRAIKNLGQSAKELGSIAKTVTFTLGIPGTNIMLELDIPGTVLRALGIIGDEIGRLGEKFSDPLWMGFSFWYGKSLLPILAYELRNYIPLETPTYREAEEMWNKVWAINVASGQREAMFPKDLGDNADVILESIRYFMKIRGYSDYLLKIIFAYENEFFVKVKDRFQKDRTIPLADAWRIPSPSDLVIMMIRDVFWDFIDFEVAMRIHGYNKDTAILYYYLHYKYPSPEKLGEFFWRGVTGVLWYPDSMMEESVVTALGLTGLQAKAPKELNFQFKDLRDSINRYMKWHDYAPFPWVPGFTTDKAIITELMADLPDKIDFRWMTRWGILEHLSKLGVGLTTTVDQIVPTISKAVGNELVSEAVSPEISLDVSLLARFLVARGVHPYFAAISAVAEAHTMLTDEMSLLRSGFLELYRWGMANIKQIEKLLSGLFVVKFTTAYLDLESGKWQTVTYNKPVFWLPAERRLIQMRAAIDRYYELFRDFVREVERGVRFLSLHTKKTIDEIKDYVSGLQLDKETSEEVSKALAILQKYKKADDLIKEYGSIVTTMLRNEVRSISGVDVAFTIDDMYIDTWIKMAELTRDIESRTWIRHYATRLVAWIIYRTSYGWTPVEKFKNLTAILLARGWLTIEEKEFLDTVAEWVYGIVRREMIPTPVQLATFSEYMKVPDNVIEKVLDEHRVPDEYRQLYKQYIAYRFVKSDYRTYLNRARRAYVMGIINDAEWSKILAEAVDKYGFRQEEVAVIQMLAELEELMESARVWRPSLTTIATISEVVPIPKETMDKIIERFRVDPLIAPYVKEYVKRRPLLDELRILVNEYYRLRYYADLYKQVVPSDVEQAVHGYMQLFGLTEEEKAIRELAVLMRELAETWRESARENVPTPSMLATIYEYVPTLTDDMINKVFEARGVPPDWRKVWFNYIKNRVIADDVRSLVSAFYRMKRYAARYGQPVPEDISKAVEGYMARIGFTEEEKKIRELASGIDVIIEMWRESAREYIPTPSMLATIYEYVPSLTDQDIVNVLRERNVPEKWINIWVMYIKARAIADDVRALITAYYSMVRYAARYGQKVPDDITKSVQSYMQLIGFSKEELEVRQLVATIYDLIETWREWRPSLPTLISMIEYVPEAIGLLNYYNVDPRFRPVVEKYARIKPLADEFRSLLNLYYKDYIWFKVPQEIVNTVNKYSKLLGFTDEELRLRSLRAWLDWLDDLWREWRLTPARIVSLAEYVPIDIEIIDRYLRYAPIDEDEKELWIKYIRLRPIKSDYRAVISTALRALRYRAITEDRWKKILEDAKGYGFTDPEIGLLQLRSELELAIEEAREYIPTPSMLATIAEYVPSITDEMISKVLEARRVPQEWRAIWIQYIKARAIADEVRGLLSAFYRMKRYAVYYGYVVPKDIEDTVIKYAKMIGVTDVEMSIRDLTASIESTIDMWRTGEVYPTLSLLATMSEYIDVPVDYIKKVIEVRRIESTYASLWLQYVAARTISGEVNRVVTAFTNLYVRYAVPDDVVKRVTDLMASGGWTSREIRIFNFELELRRAYRVLTMLIPSIRQFIADAQYLSDYEKLFQDILQVYAIDVEKYKKQVEYYKRLLKNRRLWRHFSWYRTQLTYAYMYGAMDENQIKQKLQQFVNIGLIDPDELNIIIDGIKIRAVAYAAYRATRYGT